jgi:hypothetical protein
MPATLSREECAAGEIVANTTLPAGIQAGLLTRGGSAASPHLPTQARQMRSRGSGSVRQSSTQTESRGPPLTVAGPWPVFAAFPFLLVSDENLDSFSSTPR